MQRLIIHHLFSVTITIALYDAIAKILFFIYQNLMAPIFIYSLGQGNNKYSEGM
jgi:hypothetical protein